MMWAFGQTKNLREATQLMIKNVVLEFSERRLPEEEPPS